jgi:hypothetical protein
MLPLPVTLDLNLASILLEKQLMYMAKIKVVPDLESEAVDGIARIRYKKIKVPGTVFVYGHRPSHVGDVNSTVWVAYLHHDIARHTDVATRG